MVNGLWDDAAAAQRAPAEAVAETLLGCEVSVCVAFWLKALLGASLLPAQRGFLVDVGAP